MSDGTIAHVEVLKEDKMIKFRSHGNSMVPLIYSGQLVTITLVDPECQNGCALHFPFAKNVFGVGTAVEP